MRNLLLLLHCSEEWSCWTQCSSVQQDHTSLQSSTLSISENVWLLDLCKARVFHFLCDAFWVWWIFKDSFIANFPQSPPVKESWKSVENWQSYRSRLAHYFFGTKLRIENKCKRISSFCLCCSSVGQIKFYWRNHWEQLVQSELLVAAR